MKGKCGAGTEHETHFIVENGFKFYYSKWGYLEVTHAETMTNNNIDVRKSATASTSNGGG